MCVCVCVRVCVCVGVCVCLFVVLKVIRHAVYLKIFALSHPNIFAFDFGLSNANIRFISARAVLFTKRARAQTRRNNQAVPLTHTTPPPYAWTALSCVDSIRAEICTQFTSLR